MTTIGLICNIIYIINILNILTKPIISVSSRKCQYDYLLKCEVFLIIAIAAQFH